MISIAEIIETIQVYQRRGWLEIPMINMFQQMMDGGDLRPDRQPNTIPMHMSDDLAGWSFNGIFYGFMNECDDPIIGSILNPQPITLELLAYGLSQLDIDTID